ncbi:hypothetical protein ACWC5C_16750 [Streptomyces sp. NPDC001700]
MAEFLFPTLVFAPLVAPWVVVVVAVVLVLRACAYRRLPGGGWQLPSVSSCVLVAVMAGAAAYGAYAWGVMSGFFVLDPDQMCTVQGLPGDHIVTRWTLPVSARCVTPGGLESELVPGWVNPVVFLGLALFVSAVVAGTLAGARRRANQSA